MNKIRVIDKLSDSEAGKLLKALYHYCDTGELPKLSEKLELVMLGFVAEIDSQMEAFKERQKRNRLNGMKGGRPKKTQEQAETLFDVPQAKPQAPRGFVPPSVEEVLHYCKEKGYNNVDAEYFVNYYAARGWLMTNGLKMKSWTAAVSYWQRKPNYGGQKQVFTEPKKEAQKSDYEWK